MAEPVGGQVDGGGGGERVGTVGDVGAHRVSPAEEQVPDLHRPAVRTGAAVHDGAESGRRVRPDEQVDGEVPARRDVERGVRGNADQAAGVEVQAAAPAAGSRRGRGRAERSVVRWPAGEQRGGVRHLRRGAGLVVEVVERDGVVVDRIRGGREPRHREVRTHEVEGGAAGACRPCAGHAPPWPAGSTCRVRRRSPTAAARWCRAARSAPSARRPGFRRARRRRSARSAGPPG